MASNNIFPEYKLKGKIQKCENMTCARNIDFIKVQTFSEITKAVSELVTELQNHSVFLIPIDVLILILYHVTDTQFVEIYLLCTRIVSFMLHN